MIHNKKYFSAIIDYVEPSHALHGEKVLSCDTVVTNNKNA